MKIVAVTSCPTGVAHTRMAAEALKKTAAVMGHEIRVETQGAEGTRDELTPDEIAAADVVVLATGTRVDPARFAGKPVHEVHVSNAIRNTRAVLDAALALAPAGEAPPAPAPPEPAQPPPAVGGRPLPEAAEP